MVLHSLGQVEHWSLRYAFMDQHRQQEGWLIIAHRILARFDLACHHADASYFSRTNTNEEDSAKLRVASLSAFMGASGHGTTRLGRGSGEWGPRPFKRSKQEGKSTKYCDIHKACNHTTAECRSHNKPQSAGK